MAQKGFLYSVKVLGRKFMLRVYPQYVINKQWKKKFGYPIDWKHPRDINEKIQWLLVNTDTTEWSRLADKIKVRDYVKECDLENLLIPLYGTWENAKWIPYDELPPKFVLKCNHDSGSSVIVDKAKSYDKKAINSMLNNKLKRDYGLNGELHYSRIAPPRILAEQYLEQDGQNLSTSLIDYKVWCFDGKPFCVMTYHNRTRQSVYLNVYGMNWNVHPEYCLFNDKYLDGQGVIQRPKVFDEMIKAASRLSQGFPEVRVDFYVVADKLYFGEMTFTSMCGMMQHYTPEFLKMLGDMCILPCDTPQ